MNLQPEYADIDFNSQEKKYGHGGKREILKGSTFCSNKTVQPISNETNYMFDSQTDYSSSKKTDDQDRIRERIQGSTSAQTQTLTSACETQPMTKVSK